MINSSRRLSFALSGAALMIGCAGSVSAESTPDPAPLFDVKGKVAQYALTPRGGVDGLILSDGTEVGIPPHTSTALVFAVRPGDAVTIRGRKSVDGPVVNAVVVTNDGTGVVLDTRPPSPSPQSLEAESRIAHPLHDRSGHINGVLLESGTIVRLPPAVAEKQAASLEIGRPFFARGDGVSGPLGKVIAAREIGKSRAESTRVDETLFERWKHELFGDDAEPSEPKAP